ncbi:hypothetical protein EBR78_08990, partial [bacterium]|nr:hypothetical protein [bacterium]
MKVFRFKLAYLGMLAFSVLVFGEHRNSKKPSRQKVASLASQCSSTAFETQFGAAPLENKKVSSGSLFPITEVTETKYAISGSRGATPPTTYQAIVGWRHTAPTDSAFRSAVAQAFLCTGEGHTDAFKTLNQLLEREDLFQHFQPVRGALQKNKNPHAQEEDVLRLRKMRSLLEELSRLLAEAQDNSELKEFVRALFKQIELNERTLPQPLSLHEDLLKQLKRIQSGEPES